MDGTSNNVVPWDIGDNVDRDSLIKALRESVAVKQSLVDSLLAENVKLRRLLALYGAGVRAEVEK